MGIVAKIVGWIPAIIKIGMLVNRIRKAVKECKEAGEAWASFVDSLEGALKKEGRKVLKQSDEATESLAQVCDCIPPLKGVAQPFRDMIRKRDYGG